MADIKFTEDEKALIVRKIQLYFTEERSTRSDDSTRSSCLIFLQAKSARTSTTAAFTMPRPFSPASWATGPRPSTNLSVQPNSGNESLSWGRFTWQAQPIHILLFHSEQ